VYNGDKISSFSIRQKCDLRGKNVLRTHKIDIAVYDENLKPHIIENVVLNSTKELTEVNLNYDGNVKAIVINHGLHTYSKVRFDERSLKCFEKDLSKFDEYLTRLMIWRNLWFQMLDGHLNPIQYINLVLR
jgi:aminopeptidase N